MEEVGSDKFIMCGRFVLNTYHANARGNRVHDTEELAFVESSLSEAVHFSTYRVFTGGRNR